MSEHRCPKCAGKLLYSTAEKLFVCQACENRYFREVILGSVAESDDQRGFYTPHMAAEGEVRLTSQYEPEKPPVDLPPPPVLESERLGAHVAPKAPKVTRRTQRYMARYDREQGKKERDRLEAEAESRRWEASLSEEYRRANLKAVGVPSPDRQAPLFRAPAPLSEVAAPVASVSSPEEVPEDTAPTRERLELALSEARLTLKERQQTLRRLSSDIWRLERAPGQTRREFRDALAEANREIDRAGLAVKEAEVAVKEAKRRLKKAK